MTRTDVCVRVQSSTTWVVARGYIYKTREPCRAKERVSPLSVHVHALPATASGGDSDIDKVRSD